MNKKSAAVALTAVTEFFVSRYAYAAPIRNIDDFINKLCLVFGWMFTFLIALSSIMGLVGAYFYLTSGGDSEKVTRANKTIVYAVIGVVFALAAEYIPWMIARLLGASGLELCYT